MAAIVYGKPIVFKSNVVFPSVSNNFRGTQLTWQYHHRRRLGFMCYHQSRADEQLKLVSFKETPASQIVKPKPKRKPKPERKWRLLEKLLIGAFAASAVGFVLVGTVIMPKEMVRVQSESSIPYEDNPKVALHMFLSLFCSLGLLFIQFAYVEVDEGDYEIRLALKIAGAIFLLGFLTCSVQSLSLSYAMDTLTYTLFRDWKCPLNLYSAICWASYLIWGHLLIAVNQHYDKVYEDDSEKGLDFKVFGAISMGLEVACSPEFMSIAYAIDTLSRTVLRTWRWPYDINLAKVFILLHICCRGVRAVVDLHHKHSSMPGCEQKSFNKRSSKQITRPRKKSSRRRTNQQKKDLGECII